MSRKFLKNSRGMTLIEILTVISIIGVLASIGNVSFEEVKRLGRDVRRTSDMKQLQTALELYFASHNSYPGDGVPGPGGVVLGAGGATALDDTQGWTKEGEGIVFLRIPIGNPGPNGASYVYRSMDAMGNDCDKNCSFYEVRFTTEGKLGDLPPGEHSMTMLGIVRPEGVQSLVSLGTKAIVSEGMIIVGRQTLEAVRDLEEKTKVVLDNPQVEKAGTVVAPASLALPLAGAAAAAGAFALPQYLIAFFTQPLLLLFRRKKKNWGVVYNSLTKLPIDLAVVRLINWNANKIAASSVTDKEGRFYFIAPPGTYKIETQKQNLSFPSVLLSGLSSDSRYNDLYFGGPIDIRPQEVPHPNIPMDPEEGAFDPQKVSRRNKLRSLQYAFSVSGPVFAAAAFVVNPHIVSGSVLALHVFLFMFFRRLIGISRIKSFGVVYDEITRTPISRAILRFYALPYHKLVETKISDSNGRYSFLVGPGEFYLTVEREGYGKTQTDPVKIENPKGAVINASIPLRKVSQ